MKRMMSVLLLALAACAGEPRVVVDPDPPGPPRARTGSGAWTFEAIAGWGAGLSGPTHGGVALDKAGNVYVSTDSEKAIHVFAPDGTLLRTMASPFRAIHQMVMNDEGGTEFLYGAHLPGHQAVKLALDGTVVWTLGAPMESGKYRSADQMNPTAVAVASDGSVFIADGYATSFIHKFDRERKYVKSFGGPGQLNGCHSIAIDRRGAAPLLLVCDRENRRLVHYDLDGNFVAVLATGLRRPSSIAFFGGFVAIAELEARVVILDKHHEIVAVLGDNPNRGEWANYGVPRTAWKDAIFTAPHGLRFDPAGNLYVQDWNETGRVRKFVRARLALGSPFGDHMVLQRDREVRVWGWATPGARVRVSIAGTTSTADVGIGGDWRATIGPLAAGGPHEMTVTCGSVITIKDVLVGDVWLCSGQSNMEWPLAAAKDGKAEVAAANHPEIRLFSVSKAIAAAPRETCENSGWTACAPQSAGSFSAVGYFFGRAMQEKLRVPIGLIHSSWGGTVCEAWTSAGALKQLDDFKQAIAELEAARVDRAVLMRKYDQAVAAWEKRVKAMDPDCSTPGLDDSKWKTMELPKLWESELGNFDGSVWFRREVEIPESLAGRELTLSLGAIDDQDTTWFNGTRVGGYEEPGYWATPRVYKVPASLVKAGKAVIAVRAYDTGGAGGFSGKEMTLASISLAGAWRYKIGLDLKKIPPPPPGPAAVQGPNSPTALFNAMIAPLVPFGMKGVIWYQGESNAGRAKQYQSLFPAMIRDWREALGENCQFCFVQLANFMAVKPEPGESAWAELREAQAMTLSMPNTGMAVAIDIGEAGDIHPRNKQEVGRRLAEAAMGKSGPIFKTMKVQGAKLRLSFDHGPLASKGELKGFAIAGADGKFVWAESTIDGGDVVVWNEKVTEPKAARYAWADNPAGCNVCNQEGLPASPFRTDRK